MQEIKEQRLTGERALFRSKDLSIEYSIFADGESPLKESRDISLKNTSFQWKYPLWYCRNITVQDCDFAEMARAGICIRTILPWQTHCMRLRRAFDA